MLKSAMMTIRSLRLKPNHSALLCLSCEHIAGKMMVVRAFAGKLNLITAEPSSNPLKDISETQRIDFAAFVPLQVNEMLSEKKTAARFERIKKIIIGGAPVSSELRMKLKNLKNSIYETYGMTETISHVALKRLSGSRQDEDFEALESVSFNLDERGCLVVTAPHLSDVPIITNDVVKLRTRRRFKWLGRFDNVINSGGVKLFPEILEEKVRHLIARRYFFAGRPDKRLGEKPVLVIEGKGFSENELVHLKSALGNCLGKYEVPKEIIFLPEFRTTANGKIIRKVPLRTKD